MSEIESINEREGIAGGFGSARRKQHRAKITDTAPSGGSTSRTKRRLRVTPDEIPKTDRINVTVEDKTLLVKVRKALRVKHFSRVYNVALERLAESLREEGYDL